MPRRILRQYLPAGHHVRDHKYLKIFGTLLHDPNLWHLNRHSVSGGVALGLFCAFLPMPFETLVATLGALAFRVNLPISIALVWVSNPFTWIPMYGTAYLLGAWLLNLPRVSLDGLTITWLLQQFAPLWLGSLIIGLVLAGISYVTVQSLWRFKVKKNWEKRKMRMRRSRNAGRTHPDFAQENHGGHGESKKFKGGTE